MTRLSDDEIVRLVRKSLSPSPEGAPASDLWLQIRQRIEHGAPPPAPWEWALTAVVVLACLLQPAVLRVVLLNF
jgi:hypothetical protein